MIFPDSHPSLRTPCLPVTEITPALKMLAMSMLGCLPGVGVGLAANQVGKNCRLLVMDSKGVKVIMFNPEIIEIRGNLITQVEGCLSSRGKLPYVPRYLAITVKWINELNQPRRQMFTGLHARIIQHEMAHLDGILMSDDNPHCNDVTRLSLLL